MSEPLTRGELGRRLDLGLHHGGLGSLVAEPFDDLFQLGLFLGLVLLGTLGHLFFFGDGLPEFFHRTLHLAYLVTVNARGMGADLVHKMMVVGNQQYFALPVAQKPAEPTHGDDVQVVCRFVQQQHVGFRGQHLCQVQADLETAG